MQWSGILGGAIVAAIGPLGAAYVLAALGLNLQFGCGGMINLGQVAFMLTGAYGMASTVSILGLPWPIGVAVGMFSSLVLALVLGVPTLRLRTDYLAIATLACASILQLVVSSSPLQGVTGGVYGLKGFAGGLMGLSPFPPTDYYEFGPVVMSGTDLWMACIGWACVAITFAVLTGLMRSPWGRALIAIREDENVALALGKNAFRYRLQALLIGGALGGMAGILIAFQMQVVVPDAFAATVTFYLYISVLLGGLGNNLGAIAGSMTFWFLFVGTDLVLRNAWSTSSFVQDHISEPQVGVVRFVLVGLALILLMIFRPDGVLPSRGRRHKPARAVPVASETAQVGAP